MNKADKRQRSIRNKLMAAVAMLLVASIMTVTTTYAWFTLSTAPEVQGITTTVGANGNLEIALSPASGSEGDVGSAVGDSLDAWTEKNETWGNLLNLSDSSYRLDEITLLPARLNSTLGTNPLMTPVYGADGRIKNLDANTTYGAFDVTQQDFVASSADAANFGVRVVGTSASMTEYQSSFYNNLSKMANSMNNSQDKAEASLNNNGAALAQMAIDHVNAGDTDSNEYDEYLDSLQAVITDLTEANGYLEQGIRAALMAIASSSESSVTAYELAKNTIVDANSLPSIWTTMTGSITIADTNPLKRAYDVWTSVNTDLADAQTALNAAKTKADDGNAETKVLWADVSVVMTKLMNTAGITINDKSLSEFKTLVANGTAESKPGGMSNEDWEASKQFVGSLTSGVNLQLGNGSGVYADLASAVGDLTASVTLDSLTYGITTLYYVKANIVTVTEPDAGAYLKQVSVAVQTAGALQVEGSSASSVIDVTYGYVVDFLFRTNASGSNLMLQTAAAQRVYDDSQSEATLGHGSTMTFASGTVDVQAVKGLMECVRVVFMNTATGDIYGVAKLDMTQVAQEELTAATEDTEATYNVTAPLYLYAYDFDANGALTFTTLKNDVTGTTTDTADDAVICALPTNTAARVSAMVYLDGDNVGNEDVANAASSMTGTMNLQFASSATLVPMENTALENLQLPTYKVNVTVDGEATELTVNEGDSFSYTFTPAAISSVTVTMGGTEVNGAYDSATGKLSISNVSGNVVITVVTVAGAGGQG